MKVFYNLIILVLRILVSLAAFFDSKANSFVAGRRNFFRRFMKELAGNKAPVVWVHCASLGEFEQGRPVIEKLKTEFPEHKILLTFFSPSGYEVRRNYDQADYVCYLPWDTEANAKRFIRISKVKLAIFVKYEFWFHYTNELKKQNIPLLSVSAIFRPQQIFFKQFAKFYASILFNFTYFFVQNDESVRLLNAIGLKNVMRAGDTRFDRVNQLVKTEEEIPIARDFKGTDKVMVIGSCWPEDLDVIIPFINEHYFHLKFILAPHELSESFIGAFEKSVNAKTVRYSRAAGNLEDSHILLVDNIGLLGRLYRYGEFAYIGGAFGKGLHNILEAACYGIPIFFGNKNYDKFQEAVDLINRGGAFEVADYRDFKSKYEMANLPQSFLLACEVTRLYVEENLGATDKIVHYCRKILTS